MLFIYDDSIPVPTDVSDAIGISNFGSLLFRKKQIRKHILDEVTHHGITDVIHISNNDDTEALLTRIKEDNDRKILYYPSNFFPLDMEKFRVFLQKIKYSDQDLQVSDQKNPIVLMTSKSFHPYWKNIVLEKGDKNLLINNPDLKQLPCENYFAYFNHYASVHDFLSNHYETRYDLATI